MEGQEYMSDQILMAAFQSRNVSFIAKADLPFDFLGGANVKRSQKNQKNAAWEQ